MKSSQISAVFFISATILLSQDPTLIALSCYLATIVIFAIALWIEK